MPPSERPVASLRRPKFDASAIDAIGSRWEQKAPTTGVVSVHAEAEQSAPRGVSDVQTSGGLTAASSPVGAVPHPAPVSEDAEPRLAPRVVTESYPSQVSASSLAALAIVPTPPAESSLPPVAESATPASGTTSSGRSIVKRVGRHLADGSRKGARTLRRMTVYLEPERAGQLAVRCAQTGENMSDVIDRALEAYLGP